ncbi:FAD:protein FMN transferase [Paenibacillus sp. FSL H8-0548]|uniref:FAD:protein FMN transferase n=1 Tax=Paenibacillus sp. FSL H8-0548 TaxID=1920422 RepID=UPI0015C355ED|nr:FAD:protein FMN transferase [Paenibacillus sp. FSL H8-0548]
MNTRIEVQLEHEEGDGITSEQYANELRGWFEECESRFSRFRPDSELSRLNSSGGEWIILSDRLYDVLAQAESYRKATNGWFDIRILPALEAAGYDRSYEKFAAGVDARLPILIEGSCTSDKSSRKRQEGINADPAGFLEQNPGMKAVRLAEGSLLDLGGIAKSWTVAQAGLWFRARRGLRAGIINAGGDALVWQHDRNGEPTSFVIESPWDGKTSIGELMLLNGAVATSSVLGRRWLTDDGVRHHLIDPVTGQPSRSEVVQATVAGRDVVTCEIWAKVLCMAGAEAISAMQAHSPGCEALIVKHDGGIVWSGRSSSGFTCQWRSDDFVPSSQESARIRELSPEIRELRNRRGIIV